MQAFQGITDPTQYAYSAKNPIHRIFAPMLRDERDLPFVQLLVQIFFLHLPFAALLYTSLLDGWMWGVAAFLYYALTGAYYSGPFTLMLHCTVHRKLFKKEYENWNNLIPWFFGLFFGQSPKTFFAHHVGMHHAENNMEHDDSSTIGYQRDSRRAFAKYFLSFLFLGMRNLLRYFKFRKKKKFLPMVKRGEIFWFALVIALSFISLKATLVVFVAPLLTTRFAMMMGNWGQHAFVDPNNPSNSYLNSITCINSAYNRRCFNDGYHIGHHLKPTMHWTDLPKEFNQNSAKYAENRALVFEGVDFFLVTLMLMLKQHKWLASKVVNVNGMYSSEEEIMAVMTERLKPIR